MRKKLKVGDVVSLIGSDTPMTVIDADSKEATCYWMDGDAHLEEYSFPVESLKIVGKSSPPAEIVR